MVADVALYLAVHQPRRVKLPAQPIPRGASLEDMTRCLFDERLNERSFRQAAHSCYEPATRLLLDLVRRQGLRLALGISLSFMQQAALWEPALLDLLRELAAEESVELVGMDPYRSLHCLLDLPAFAMRLQWMLGEIEQIFGKRPGVLDTIGLGMSMSIYHALDATGLRGALMESSPQVMQWRSSTYLYRADAEESSAVEIKLPPRTRRSTAKISERDRLGPPYTVEDPREHAPYLLTRHEALSAEVSDHFSNRAQAGNPLYADVYADWLARAEGDYTLLAWDLATIASHQSQGIFEFMQALPEQLAQRGIATRAPGELIERFAAKRAYHLPLPRHAATLASFTNPDLYCEHEAQRVILQCMSDVYNLARLTEHPELLDLAIWLAQVENLHLLRWPGPQLASSTPREWWRLGPSGLAHEQKQVYHNALHAFEAYLPARVLRQSSNKGTVRPPARRKNAPARPVQQAASVVARKR